MSTGAATRPAMDVERTARPSRAVARWGTAVVAVAAVLSVRSYTDQTAFGEVAFGAAFAPLYAMVAVAPAVLLTGAGVLAHWSRPASRIGVLLIVEGLAWNLGTLTYTATSFPAAAELSALVVFAGYAVGAHVLIAYPDGRLRRRADRVLVTLLYLVLGPGLVVTFLFHADFGPGCSLCPANGFLLTADDTLDVAANAGWYATAGLLVVAAGLRSVPRWHAAGAIARRSLAPVYVTRWTLAGAIALWCAIGVGLLADDTTAWGLRAQVLVNVAAVAAAAGIVVVFMRSTAARAAAGTLARELERRGQGVAGLDAAIRTALRDPGARLLFRAPAAKGWLDADGRPATPRDSCSITLMNDGSALEHDPALDDDPAVVASVAAVAGLALERERLRVLVRTQAAGPPGDANALAGVLTAREREVLGLAAEGLTDAAIAERLFLTRRTIETHLGHVFAKLDIPAGSTHNRRVHAVRRFLHASRRAS